MKKLHYTDNDQPTPVCGVFKSKREVTNNLDDVTCRSCIRWQAHVMKDVSLFERFYA